MYNKIIDKIKKKKINISIIGLGYVGLPLTIGFLKKNFKVQVIEKNLEKIKLINSNKSPIKHISNKEIKNLKKKKFSISSNYKNIASSDIIIICLPTPMTKTFSPDMSLIKESFNKLTKYTKPYQTIILESTVYPGATRDIFYKKINSKFEIGNNFFLAYSPEREDPGNKNSNMNKVTKLISGATDKCLKIAENLYSNAFKKVYKLSSIEVCEMTKLYENIYRSVNIGMANEMKVILDKLNLDIYEVIKAAKTKPFGFHPFYPGPGLGGHCIPIDPHFLTWVANKKKIDTKFIQLSAKINRKMPNYIFKKLKKILNSHDNRYVLILGAAYKKNIDDTRESPFIHFSKILIKNKIKFKFHDPYVNQIYLNNKKFYSSNLTIKLIKNANVTVILTDHDAINYRLVKKYSSKILDTRGKFKPNNINIF